jgi:hypothetical protein
MTEPVRVTKSLGCSEGVTEQLVRPDPHMNLQEKREKRRGRDRDSEIPNFIILIRRSRPLFIVSVLSLVLSLIQK